MSTAHMPGFCFFIYLSKISSGTIFPKAKNCFQVYIFWSCFSSGGIDSIPHAIIALTSGNSGNSPCHNLNYSIVSHTITWASECYAWYLQASGPLVMYTPLTILLWKIAPKNAMHHSGQLKPIILTAFRSCTPISWRLLANALHCSQYCFQVQVCSTRPALDGLCTLKAGDSGRSSFVFSNTDGIVLGPKNCAIPPVLMRIGSSTDTSVVQKTFRPPSAFINVSYPCFDIATVLPTFCWST